ncbi:choice-of-anchor A family protein [Streptomyces sp. NBC_00094]|uniref:choice-of-anchor A family protein n=1 Tax=Streptomyces sp. NBC_00094 TaxID=2903620 RepID=UPI0022548B57|nr:choice-of-anchor A family protein [Streptomyces sp. NBC_00094]MCX5390623.1 choice-of-anchor A family protein [Streptomyces sp. NBC_00094]
MRTTAAVAAVLAVTGTALAWAPAVSATPATSCATNPLGAAGLYAEFVEQDSTRYSDSEGAVAVGGDAYFGDAKVGQGFSIGHKLTGADLAKLPGGHSLVVGGTLHANQVVINKGSGVYGSLDDRSVKGAGFAVDGPHAKGASPTAPIDFAKEFTSLRALSTGWAGTTPNGTVAGDKDAQGLFLTGTDPELNVFAVAAADLQKARAITLKVPAGSSTLVNVLGETYDMNASATYGVYYQGADGTAPVIDDYALASDEFRQIRSKLLWNFPQAETVRKNYTSWPGTILAPNATVEMGGKNIGPGHVNGSVIAEELVTVPGAETHQMNFAGCLPKETTPGTVVTPEPPTPTETTVPTPPATPEPTPTEDGGTPGASQTPEDSASPSTPAGTPEAPGTPEASETPATPGDATTAPGSTPAPSATPEGDLATTGSAIGPGAIGAAAAAVLVGGGFLAFAKRRRRAS